MRCGPSSAGLSVAGIRAHREAQADEDFRQDREDEGVITATFGGVLRDIVCNEIPSAFRDHRPYAICAFASCAGERVKPLFA